ncbi:unnamed protein product [Protopolystoma xenopodis]|uniref:Fibronectin type-III domain-containing protein n=1 Tax=Protopolystoma xenopodis TaxID=117903 RepID=A0A3S5B7L4_9PLAT|nr:unnamed protein product [Protopolystoma xenopodis]
MNLDNLCVTPNLFLTIIVRGETSYNIPSLQSDSGNDYAYYGLRTRIILLQLSEDYEVASSVSNVGQELPESDTSQTFKAPRREKRKISVPGSTASSVLVSDLTPDNFYRITAYPMTRSGLAGEQTFVQSSPRVPSRKPTAPPGQVAVSEEKVGAEVATITWVPPPLNQRNGEIIAYHLYINSEELLQPIHRQLVGKSQQSIAGKRL